MTESLALRPSRPNNPPSEPFLSPMCLRWANRCPQGGSFMAITFPEVRVGNPIQHEALTVFPLFTKPSRAIGEGC